MKDSQVSLSSQLLWHLNYAEYFTRIGALAKAKAQLSQAGEIYRRNFSTPTKRTTRTERAEKVLAVARAGSVFSLIAFEESELDKAIAYIDYTIRVLKTGITAAEKTVKTARSSQDCDPFSSDPRPRVETAEKKGVKFGPKLWTFKSVLPFMDCLRIGIFCSINTTRNDVNIPRKRSGWRILAEASL